MAFKATRNMPFSLVLQKLSRLRLAVKSVAVILKVPLVNLLAALNFVNVFLKIKIAWKIKKTLKRKKRDENNNKT